LTPYILGIKIGGGSEAVMYCSWSQNNRIATASDDCIVAIYKPDIDRKPSNKIQPQTQHYGITSQGKN
jgi:hypothetical protein